MLIVTFCTVRPRTPGWTLTHTLTPSAINSWIGEEGLVHGLEASVQTEVGDHNFGATFGLFTGADTAGTILAFRGWALGDLASSNDTALPLPDGGNGGYKIVFLRQAPVSRPMVEVDGRAGYYLRLDWRPPAPVAFDLFYDFNPGNPTIVKHGQYGWSTRFAEGGMRYQPDDKDLVLAQALWGRTKMGAVATDGLHPVDISFDSAYVLWSHPLPGDAKLSGRLDDFEVVDYSLVDLDNNNERGYSATLAWTRSLNPHLDLTLETVGVTSRRPARLTQFEDPHQAQMLVQAAFKFHL